MRSQRHWQAEPRSHIIMEREYVLASGNQGKLREIVAMLKPLGFVVRPQSDWRVPEADESAGTFIENALIKARQAAKFTGLASIADDSGLVVPVLNGLPGIYSARYAGAEADDEANKRKLLTELSGRRGKERCAYFICAMVLVQSADDPAPLLAIGRWHGQVLDSPRGLGGFGYDPLFGIAGAESGDPQRSAAELSPAEKSRVSHRGQALRELVRQIRERDEGFIA
ncbi:MAG: RdgB/HAM1 family non-canonical purine NTP pyrophosphatase [Lysobacterales bacterium]